MTPEQEIERQDILDQVNNKGNRYNEGKERMGLLPPLALKEISKVLTKGAEKYSDWNWLNGLDLTDQASSLMRHYTSWMSGETNDPETNLNHLAHMGCNILFMLETSIVHPELDDRPKVYNKIKE